MMTCVLSTLNPASSRLLDFMTLFVLKLELEFERQEDCLFTPSNATFQRVCLLSNIFDLFQDKTLINIMNYSFKNIIMFFGEVVPLDVLQLDWFVI